MKTDRLIEILSTNIEPVERGRIGKSIALALGLGALGAFCAMLAIFGPRADFGSHPYSLALKLFFTLTLLGAGTAYLARLMHPGRQGRALLGLISLPFLVLAAAAAAALLLAPPSSWRGMVLGAQWASCLYCIPLFALIPFAALIRTLRNGAPTNLAAAGAVAGLVAGAVGAVAYSFHGADDSVPFIAVWYGAAIGLCALVGAILGPRLLKW